MGSLMMIRTPSPSRERRDCFVADLTGDDIAYGLAQDIDALLDLRSAQDQRRCDLEHVPPVPRVVDNQAKFPGAVDDFSGGRLVRLARGAVLDQLDSLDHAQTTNIADELDVAKSLDQAFMQVTTEFRRMLNQVESLDLVQHRYTGGTARGIASGGKEGGAGGGVEHLSPGNDGAQRHPAAERFAEQDDVGLDAAVLVRKHLARAGKPDLDLVDREQDAVAIAESPQLRHEVGGWDHVAAVALHRFDEDGGHVPRLA